MLGTTPKPKKEFPIVPLVTLLLVAALAAGGFAWWRANAPQGGEGPPISAEGKAYSRSLGLSDVQMKATESFVAQRIVEIEGKITNKGDRKVKSVEVRCVFSDPYGQYVHRERVAIVKERSGGLAPGETKPFRLPFDALPATWNQAMPQLVISQIEFAN